MKHMEPRICLRDGTFSYGAREIFTGLNLDLDEGDVFCLLGPNGCGKTTLLRCLNCALRLKQGSVWIDGRDAASLDETERAQIMGFVFQEHNILFSYPVIEIVCMGRAPHLGFLSSPSRRDMEIAERALETVGIAHLRDTRYTEISGGERQLVLIARALAQEPMVLLLDEPTSHLDFGNQMLILETIVRLAQERGLTVIMATHFPNHALLASNRVALMKDGGFVAVGWPERVITTSNLKELYGVDVEIVSTDHGTGKRAKAVVPVFSVPDGPWRSTALVAPADKGR